MSVVKHSPCPACHSLCKGCQAALCESGVGMALSFPQALSQATPCTPWKWVTLCGCEVHRQHCLGLGQEVVPSPLPQLSVHVVCVNNSLSYSSYVLTQRRQVFCGNPVCLCTIPTSLPPEGLLRNKVQLSVGWRA